MGELIDYASDISATDEQNLFLANKLSRRNLN